MKIKPLYDRVVLEPEKTEEKTFSGIVLPESAKVKSQMGKVICIGNGKTFDGTDTEMQVKAGDRVLYSKYSGTEIKIDGQNFVIVRQTDILAVIGGNN